MTARTARNTPDRRQAKQLRHTKCGYRRELLSLLRAQSRRIGHGYFTREAAPLLHDLAMAADAAPRGKRSFIFLGVRFRMAFGWRRYVIDPETGETLIGGGFLV
ncbi:hypothetical protein MASR1M42_22230 [Azonexus hydrophilus]